MEIATYAELINQKILVPGQQTGYVQVEAHFLISCMLPVVQQIKVDDDWYIQAYPDVQQAIQKGIVLDARYHYYHFGFYEHRMPYRIIVDEPWYQAQYSDVRAAIVSRHFVSAQEHYELEGFREGRVPYPNFRLELTDGAKASIRAQGTGRVGSFPSSRNKMIAIGAAPG
jgi:hypothetical protein